MRRRSVALLALLLLLAAGARLALALPALGRSPLPDPDNYLALARSVAEGQGYRLQGRLTAYRPPLYPLTLAPLLAALDPNRLGIGIAVYHALLGVVTVALTVLAARRLDLPPAGVAIAGVVVAFDPVLVAQSRHVMTETLSATLMAAAVAALVSRGRTAPLVAGGLLYGLGALCRPSALPAAALTAAAILTLAPGTRRDRLRRAVLFSVATALPLLPWALRNARALGEPIWTTTHGGYTLALANNPVYYQEVLHGPPGTVWSGPRQDAWWTSLNRATEGCNEPQADRVVRDIALGTIRDQPGDFALAVLDRLSRLWGIAPSAGVYPLPLRILTGLWTIPLWIGVLAGLAHPSLRRWPGWVLLAPPIALTIIHALYWTDLRMRAPVLPVLALISAHAVRSWSFGSSRVRMRWASLVSCPSPRSNAPGSRHG
jgi:hypothetical protein